jgi:hypothetical protein
MFGSETIFAARDCARTTNAGGFEVRPFHNAGTSRLSSAEFDHVILHYVNYGYQARGIPFGLVSIMSDLRQACHGRVLTIFHELYASGAPWKSAFWLQPLQKRIARTLAQLSEVCLVSSEAMLRDLGKLASNVKGLVHPVLSNFGEPDLPPNRLFLRDPHRLSVFGGNDNSTIRSLLVECGIQTDYRPRINSADASSILSASSFLWLDYFDRTNVPMEFVLKSTAFAAACAHGVVPIFPHRGSEILIEGDRLPGSFFIEADSSELPSKDSLPNLADRFYGWYQRHASSDHLARGIARALQLTV